MTKLNLRLLLSCLFALATAVANPKIASSNILMDEYPFLNQFLYSEKQSKTYIGFGVSPVGFQNSKLAVSANIFQIYYIGSLLDLELLSISYGFTFGQPAYVQDHYFLFRTSPKIKVFSNVSIGPLFGVEMVEYSNLGSLLNKNGLYAPSQPFSATGLVYGFSLTETFNLEKYLLKINQVFFHETYSSVGTSSGWTYFYDQNDINLDPTPITAGNVFLLEVSFLY